MEPRGTADMSGYGSAPAPKGDDNGKPVDPKWVTTLREYTGAGTTSSERLDVAKFVFIMLVSSGHFLEPFYKIGNRGVGAYMHAIYGFHVPAFVLISGYVSGDLNPKRRRALIAGTLAPYVIMHVLFSLFYTRAFCEGEWTDERGHPECEFVNKWALMDPVVGQWDGTAPLKMTVPVSGDMPSVVLVQMPGPGRILAAVDQHKLTDNTMIVFTSDNGGLYRRYDYREHADDNVATQAPLKGEKGSLHEGGVRVPLIVRYPAAVKAGSVCHEPTISYDFYPTFAELAGAKLPVNQTIDGHSLMPLLRGATTKLQREELHWHYPHYHHDRPASSIRARDWKLIEYLDGTGDLELYNLKDDLGESRNLAATRPGRTAELKQRLNKWRQQVSARMPIPNPNYSPKRAGEWWSMRTGKPVNSDGRKRFPPTELDL